MVIARRGSVDGRTRSQVQQAAGMASHRRARRRSERALQRVDECPVARALPSWDHVVHHVAKGDTRTRISEADRAPGAEVPEAARIGAERSSGHCRLEAEAEGELLQVRRAS